MTNEIDLLDVGPRPVLAIRLRTSVDELPGKLGLL